MAWSYADWQTKSTTVAITAVSTTAGTFTVALDQTAQVRAGDRLSVDAGANIGSYTVGAVAYAHNVTTVSVSPLPSSAVVAGNLVFGPYSSTMLANLRLHYAEVSNAISQSVSANGTSVNTDSFEIIEQGIGVNRRAIGTH